MKVEIRKSEKHGYGIFARRNISENEIILKWDINHEIPKNIAEKLSQEEKKYICYLNEKYILMQSPECYMNHSCNANSRAENFCDIAIRDIKAGEEITANYNEVSSGGPVIQCNCGSDNCVGKIFS